MQGVGAPTSFWFFSINVAESRGVAIRWREVLTVVAIKVTAIGLEHLVRLTAAINPTAHNKVRLRAVYLRNVRYYARKFLREKRTKEATVKGHLQRGKSHSSYR